MNLEKLKVRIVNQSGFELPAYKTALSAGLDLKAVLENSVTLGPLERKLVKTGLFIELPAAYEAQVRPRSGMALKQGLTVLNTPGTIDADYRGEIGVVLVNLSNQKVTIENGERIAQLIVARHEQVEWVETSELDSTERGSGGFGSTGTH